MDKPSAELLPLTREADIKNMRRFLRDSAAYACVPEMMFEPRKSFERIIEVADTRAPAGDFVLVPVEPTEKMLSARPQPQPSQMRNAYDAERHAYNVGFEAGNLAAQAPRWWDKAEKRAKETQEWLEENASYTFKDQKHCDANTSERAYWHHGYLMALKDILKLAALPTAPREG